MNRDINTQKQQSYENLHNKKKFSSGDKESYIQFLEDQLKKLTDTLVESDQIKERLELVENQMERIQEKTDKFQKINKLLQTCVDNQEEDLKTFKDKIYLDIDMKFKVLDSKFDVDDKLESNLNKKFNQKQRDFEKLVDNFDKKIQANYEEFSSEIAIDLKQMENKLEEKISSLKNELLYWMKGEIESQQKDRQLYTHFQEFRSSINEQFDLQKTELSAYFELLSTKTKSSFNEFTQKIEERLQHYEYSEQNTKQDDREQQKQKKDIQDLKYISNLIMEKVEKLEKNEKSDIKQHSTVVYDQQKSQSIDKIEVKLANQMSSQFEKLQNIIKQLQDQQFSIEKKIMKMDPRSMYDALRISPKKEENVLERRNDRQFDQVVEDEEQHQHNAVTIKHSRNSSSNISQANHGKERNSNLAEKYTLISEKLKQRKQIEEDEQQQQQNYLKREQHYQDDQSYKFSSQTQNFREISQESNQVQQDFSNNKKKEHDRSQNTDSLNESIEELLSKRKNIFNQKPPSGVNQFSSPQVAHKQQMRQNSVAEYNSSQERPNKFYNPKDRDSLSNNSAKKTSKQNLRSVQNAFDQNSIQQNVFGYDNQQSIHSDSFKRRSFDVKYDIKTEPNNLFQSQEENDQHNNLMKEQNEDLIEKSQPRLQKSNSLNRFEEIQKRNIQSPTSEQVDENLANHLEQRRERLKKFIQQTEQQLEEANNGFEEKLNRKYESFKEYNKSASSQGVGEQQFKTLPPQNQKFSPYSSEKNQQGVDIYSRKYQNMNMNDTFNDDPDSAQKNQFNYYRKDEEQSNQQEYDQIEQEAIDEHVIKNNRINQFKNKGNQIFSLGDDSDIMRLNQRIMTAENNTDSFSREIVSRSMSREQQQRNISNTNNLLNQLNSDDKIQEDKQNKPMINQIIQSQNTNQRASLKDNKKFNDSDSDEEEIQKVLQKYNNTKVNINDLIQKKKEEEKQKKQQIQNKLTSPTNRNQQIERSTPQSSANKQEDSYTKKGEYGDIGNRTRDLLRDEDETSYDITTSQINQSEIMNNLTRQSDLKNKDQKNVQTQKKQNSERGSFQNKNQQQENSKQNKQLQIQGSQQKKELDSFFYTKGLKYDFNFSNNTSKTKDQSKSFSMIEKVMNSSKQKK
ncbi:hypothetical protein ABPG74_012476 [Tetrahymena malaccensis]